MIEHIIEKIREKINTDFENGGCRIQNAHFQNGKNLHSDQYYFAKNYFQNTENCSELTEVLYSKLQQLDFPDETTLIGFRNYCGLLLKETINKIGKFNHAIIEENKNGFFWRHLPNLRKNLVIVLPIGCSCITYIRLRKWLTDYCSREEVKDYYVNTKVNVNFIVVFLILDKSLEKTANTLKIDDIRRSNEKLSKVFSAFNWTEINENQIFFNAGKIEGENNDTVEQNRFKVNSLVRLYSNMQLPEDCTLCFPENSVEELPLFPIHDNYENPNLIFRFPNFSKSPQQQNNFLDKFCSDNNLSNVMLRGHIDVNGTSFPNYIRGNIFYNKNRDDILQHFNDSLVTELKSDDKNIIFITSENKHSSYFLEDLALSNTFKDKKVTILRFEPSNEFVDNFVSLYSDLLTVEKNPPKIIYFEDVLSAGNAFKLVSDYIKHSRLDKLRRPDRLKRLEIHGFDLILTLVDRTPAYTRNEILKKLYSKINQNPESKFISFFRLNVPITSATHLGNPLQRKTESLKKLLKECHLDSVKATVGKEILKRRATNLPEIGLSNRNEKRMDYFPFANIESKIDKNTFDLYQPYFNNNSLDLLTLYLAHKINSELSNIIYDIQKYEKAPEKFTEDLILSIEKSIENKIDGHFISNEKLTSEFRKLKVEKEIVKDRIIKILSSPPFTYYKNIYESVFHFCVKELDKVCKKIEAESEIKSFKVFLRLKFFIQRSVELNSNFIVSERFFRILKRQYTKENLDNILNFYENTSKNLKNLKDKGEIDEPYFKCANSSLDYKRREVEAFFSYLIFCYKQIMRKNPATSLKLEELINSNELSSVEINEDASGGIQTFLSNPYFQLTEMIKAENLNLLEELKELHVKRLGTYNLNTYKSIKKYYFRRQDKNDPQIVNVNKLLLKSRHYPNENDRNRKIKNKEFSGIRTSIINFLLTVNLLKGKFNKPSAQIKSGKANLNNEIKEILDSMLSIIQPGIEKENLSYAFFVETKKKVNDNDSSSIYTITSNENESHPSKITLEENGLIYNLLHGIYDSVNPNDQPVIDEQTLTHDEQVLVDEQTLIAGAKSKYGKMVTFNDFYRVRKRGEREGSKFEIAKNSLPKIPPTKFETLFKNDLYDLSDNSNGKGVIFHDKHGKSTLPLNEANMFLAIRFSKMLKPDEQYDKYRFEGRAVLLIMNSEKSSITNFVKFMSNEKVRLLLLLREDFLRYLEEQFDNDAFTEVLNNKKNQYFMSGLRHGILENLQRLEDINFEVLHNPNELSINPDLFRVVAKTIRGQLRNFDYSAKQIKDYSQGDILGVIFLVLTSKLFSKSIDPGFINVEAIPDVVIKTNSLIFDVVFPEILINMKKYSFKESKYLIVYNEAKRTFIFENFIKPADKNLSIGHKGGIEMCKEIMERLGGRMTNQSTENETKYRVELLLPVL